MNDLKPKTAAIAVILFVAAITASALYDLQPPKPLPSNSPDSLFSADRAAGYVREISSSPHPLGSLANAAVRDYIMEQLQTLGLKPWLDTSVVTGSYNGIHYAASVIDIFVRIPGTANTEAVLLMAHYDSVPTGPGASDDGTGVATILETLRALKASSPLKNDVVAVFTDGEENGMMGAQALAKDDWLLDQMGVALNFEARGTSGPSMMFETNPHDSSGNGNGWLIKELAASCHDPVATSISDRVYKHLPNNTDFTWLKSKGVPGMNFAFIGDIADYHSQRDNYSHLNEASLQHDGSYALSLAKALGNVSLPGPRYVNYIYFNFFWPGFVTYPSSLVSAITILAAIMFALMAYIGIRKGVVDWKKGVVSLVLSVVPPAVLGVATYFLWKLLQNFYPESADFLFGAFYGDGIYLCAMIAFALALTSGFYIFLRRFFRSSEMAVGTLFWWLAAAAVSTYLFPEGAYFFQWPLIFSSFALLIFFLTPKSDFRSPIVMFLLMICSIPGIYLTASTVYLIYLTGLLPAIAAVIIVLVVLGIGTILPHVAIIASPNKWILPAASLAAAVVITVVAIMHHRIDKSHPRADSIDYAIDMNDTTAYWVSFDDSTDEWTSQFIRQPISNSSGPHYFPSWWQTPSLVAKAAPAVIQPVSIKMVADTASRGAQFLTLRVTAPQQTRSVTLTADEATQVISSSVDGIPIPDSVAIFPFAKQKRWILHYYGLPDSGATVTLVIPAGAGLKLTSIAVIPGLPEIDGHSWRPRPASMMERPFVTTDASIVVESYSF